MANEPVAWHYPDGKPDQCTTDKEYAEKDPAWTPMYYKHVWAGLTYEEESELIRLAHNHAGIRFYIQAAEAKLKEKNNG
jgi:hypothetical protein